MTHNSFPYRLLLSAILLLGGFTAAGQVKYEMVVATDGSGDYTSIQEAVNAAKAFPDKRVTIHIRNGIYEEMVEVYAWNTKITFLGESREGTIIRYGEYFDHVALGRNSTFHTPTLLVRGNDFRAENLTIENTAGPEGQAIALSVEADRAVIFNCDIKGNQDTLYLAGESNRVLIKDCTIQGTTDFIFGEATAVFKDCNLVALGNSYITAASTPEGVPYGFVFMDCRILTAPEVDNVFLGRPWRPFAKTVFIRTEMPAAVHPDGWHNWDNQESEKTSYYAEYACTGPGYSPDSRVSWSHELSAKEAGAYTLANIFVREGDINNDWFNIK